MKFKKENFDLRSIVIIILATLLIGFIIATIVLASSKNKTDCDQCLACATNPDGSQVCCHIENNSPTWTGNVYSCGLNAAAVTQK